MAFAPTTRRDRVPQRQDPTPVVVPHVRATITVVASGNLAPSWPPASRKSARSTPNDPVEPKLRSGGSGVRLTLSVPAGNPLGFGNAVEGWALRLALALSIVAFGGLVSGAAAAGPGPYSMRAEALLSAGWQ